MKKLSIVALLSFATIGLASEPAWAWGCCKCCYKFVCCCKQYNAFTPCCSGSIFCDGAACCQPPACAPCGPMGCGPTCCTSGYCGEMGAPVQLPAPTNPTAPAATPAGSGYAPPQPLPVDGARTSMRPQYYANPNYYGQVQPVGYNPYYNGYYSYPGYGQSYNPGMSVPMGGTPMSGMMSIMPPAYWYGGNMYGSSY